MFKRTIFLSYRKIPVIYIPKILIAIEIFFFFLMRVKFVVKIRNNIQSK